ncbi:MAG: hypothetical protein MI802_28360, partial [Desulfobacterales bacterium]|nr:hypothetical protein [Desulfobacterales bacterium]
MYEFNYIEALKTGTPDQIAQHLSTETGFDYDGAVRAGATPDQINDHLFQSGQVIQYQEKPEWWGEFSPEEQEKIQHSMFQYNQMNPDAPISYGDIPDRSGLIGVIKEVGSGLTTGATDRLPQNFARFLRNTFSEYDPTDEDGALDRYINKQTKDMQAEIPSAQRMAERPIQKGAHQGASNVPTSLASMAPGLAVGMVNPAAGIATSMAGSGGVFYGVAKDQFLNDIGDSFLAEHGRKPTETEWKNIYEAVEGAAIETGLWEAGTEAAGAAFSHLLFASPMGKQIGKMFAKAPGKKGAISRFIGKSFLDYGEEVGGETVSEKKQSDIQQRVGLSDQSKTYGEAFKDVAIPTAFAMGPQAGVLQSFSYLSEKIQGKPNAEADDVDISPSAPAKRPVEADMAQALANDDDQAINEAFEDLQVQQAEDLYLNGQAQANKETTTTDESGLSIPSGADEVASPDNLADEMPAEPTVEKGLDTP